MPPSPFPVLNNKPIDQWKVTELKEELKRRKLPLRGLKDELVRRLDEALREEMDAQVEDEKEVEEEEQVETPPFHSGSDDVVVEDDPPVQQQEIEEVIEAPPVQQEEVQEAPPVQQEASPVQQEEVEVKEASPVQKEVEVPMVPKEASPVQQNQTESVEEAPVPVKNENTESGSKEELEKPIEAPEAKMAEDNSDVKMEERENIQTEIEEKITKGVGVESVPASVPLDEIPKKDMKVAEEVKPDQAKPDEQVPQLGPDTGSRLKCESISSNESFKCINVENKLKDNLNADNFDLEKQVEVKQDIQDDKNKQPVNNQADTSSLEGKIHENTPSNNVNSTVGADTESPEKVNLDRSSGDDSMEEDLTESSKPLVESLVGGAQDMVKEEVNSVSAPADTDKMDIAADVKEVRPVLAESEKRKLEAPEVAPNSSENFKRQRRWNSESLKVPDLPNLSSSSTPKDLTPSVALTRTFNRSDSNTSTGSPKERIVPPSQKPATNSLRIDKFVRPFTLKAVQELLGKTGSVSSFWMDHIKTHCYVTYSSVEEATATRDAVYNLQWPSNGGNQLIAEFVDSQEVKQRVEAPPQSPAVAAAPTVSPVTTPKPSIVGQPASQQPPSSRQNSTPRNQQQQVQLPPPPPLPATGSGNAKPVKERLPPPPPLKKTDPQPAVVTLDDLFRKTKAAPRVYYLPLSEETVAAKLAARAKAAKE